MGQVEAQAAQELEDQVQEVGPSASATEHSATATNSRVGKTGEPPQQPPQLPPPTTHHARRGHHDVWEKRSLNAWGNSCSRVTELKEFLGVPLEGTEGLVCVCVSCVCV